MRKAFIFDFDDTLAVTDAKIRVFRDCHPWSERFVASLSPREFSSYELKTGEHFDFSEFKDDRFIKDADPTFLMHLAQEVSGEYQDVFILTAREDDSADAIQSFLANYHVKAKTIHCVGGTKETIPQKKKEILLAIAQLYDKIYYYDDCAKNIESVPDASNIRKYKV